MIKSMCYSKWIFIRCKNDSKKSHLTFHPIDNLSKNLFSLSLLSFFRFENPRKKGMKYISPSGHVLEYSPPVRFCKVSCYQLQYQQHNSILKTHDWSMHLPCIPWNKQTDDSIIYQFFKSPPRIPVVRHWSKETTSLDYSTSGLLKVHLA